jgi:hypothetical protein
MLNSNFDHLTTDEVAEQDKQYAAMLQKYEADSSVRSVIVATHHPPYSNGILSPSDAGVRDHFLVPFEKAHKTVLFASGHCHSYQHFRIRGKDYVVTGGAGPQQQLRQPKANAPEQDLFTVPGLRPHHVCIVERNGDRLSLTMEWLDPSSGNWSVGESFDLGH